ncbi:Ig-like domain-containing protein [Flammeovirga sp. SJP92]|uniref:Ig-like domain-containing protein n=1 Tax=Flammeovirga sp. SJP92 TaxID=1775430 RepID=UPI000A80228C|nr:Ig-like domain-containing protein [Flammeovirga sp. SJP92]
MKRFIISFLLLFSWTAYAQEAVTITYNFQNGFQASTSTISDDVLYPQRAIVGGSRLVNQGVMDNMAVTQITNNNATNYTNTFFRFDIHTNKGAKFKINKVRVIQKSDHAGDPDAVAEGGTGNTYMFRVGTQVNGNSISNSDSEQSSDNILFSDQLEETEYIPNDKYSMVKNGEYVSVYLTGRGERVGGNVIPDEQGGGIYEDDIFNWYVDQVIIEGEYVEGLSIPTFEVDYALNNKDMSAVSSSEKVSATEISRQNGESQWKQDRTFSIRLASNSNNLGFKNVGFIYDMNVASGYKAMINNYELKFAGSGEYGKSRVYRASIYHDKLRDGAGTRVDYYQADVVAGVEKYGDGIKDMDYMSAFFNDNLVFEDSYSFLIGLNRTGKTDNTQLREYFTFDNVSIRGTVVPADAYDLYAEILTGQDLYVNAVIGSGDTEYVQEIVNRYKEVLQSAVDFAFDESKTAGELTAKKAEVEALNEHFRNNTNSRSNVAPIVENKTLSTAKGVAVQFTLEGTDADNDIIKLSIKTQPQNGVISMVDGAYQYTPNQNFQGQETFTYVANDGRVDSNEGIITVTVQNENNNAPVANPQTLEVISGVELPITLEGTDVDGDVLSYEVVDQPANGTLTGDLPNLKYVSDNGFEGDDSFTFKAFDGIAYSEIATVAITVNPAPNVPPKAEDQVVKVMTSETVDITLKATDENDDALTYELVTQPANGTLSGDLPNLQYVSDNGYVGDDSFTFRAYDGKEYSNVATVSITVTNLPNTAPIAKDQDLDVIAKEELSITLEATDQEGDDLTFEIVDQPSNGTLTGDLPNLTYVSNDGFEGNDSFTFKAFDGSEYSNVATVTIEVKPIPNSVPVAKPQTLEVITNQALNITLEATDDDGDVLTYELVDQPTNGTLTGDLPNLIYTSNTDFEGDDSFTFRAFDGEDYSNTATVSITVKAVPNSVPVAKDQTLEIMSTKPLSITLEATDEDGDALTYELVDQPTNGTLTGDLPNVVYRSNDGFTGEEVFTFRAFDGEDYSNTATVTVNVTPFMNSKPVADSQQLLMNQGESKSFTLTGNDADNDPITFSILTQPSNGTITGEIPNLTYTPNPDFSGEDQMTFVINDGYEDSEVATITFLVRSNGETPSDNTAPVAEDIVLEVKNSTSTVIELKATDEDDDALTYHIVKDVEVGRLDHFGNSVEYYPESGFEGVVTFTYVANDGETESNIATVTITVVNDGQVTSIENKLEKVLDVTMTTDGIVIKDKSQRNQAVELLLYNLNGQMIFNQKQQVQPNSTVTVPYSFDINKLYLLKVGVGNDFLLKKVVFK